ncbi:protein MAINTENANCE OF MERISTEMS-like [Gossypium raimondii]|uniref:protein MAINTENANCE OF MERISTEMS-like n=1 Tax=Gossypium raimondii TaxID=29730 RepID=UPI00227D2A30|nr:protein MAINTENANCE OF MERISTEMS-like [Gossypium raimondii]
MHQDLYRLVRPRLHDPGYFPDQRVILYLNVAGFGVAAYIQTSELRADLITALVERWSPETHTFHLPCGEVTITLQDVAVQLGLSIDGEPVTELGKLRDPWGTCERLLGRVPPSSEDERLTYIKFSWLKENFEHLPSSPTQMDIMYAARAFILQLIGGILLPEVNQNKVSIMYLSLLKDLEHAGRFSWGSAVLAALYRELCRATKPTTKTMGGCCLLLQSWALYRMPFLASVGHQPYVWPFVN